MTGIEAKGIIEGLRNYLVLHHAESRREIGALDIAIRSLEAWDKVIEDINKSLSMVEDTGIRTEYVIAEKIIKDHLQEVEK